ncbi:F-box protein At4g00755-like [Coffea eugenioides]|uniref:F-box protein At4g00755-like n=1 Tax=Coffea eugenioides TaxID=49369 RepID=UPI000F613A39|nr:F-box protein At4g00755-like [Coffea eugenioides]
MEVLNMGFEPYAVIVNGICKQLCLKVFPEMSTVTRAIEISNIVEPVESRTNEPIEWACLKRDHKVYAFLAQGIASFPRKECLSEALGASSTDNYPDESIQNTPEPSDRIGQRPSYWSSKGEIDSAVPETLTYKLMAKLCVITEIHIQPFQVWFPHISSKGCKIFDGGFVLLALFAKVYIRDSGPAALYGENCLQAVQAAMTFLCIGGERDFSRIHRFGASIRDWEHMILNTLPGARWIMVNDYDYDDYDYDGEDDDSDDQYN